MTLIIAPKIDHTALEVNKYLSNSIWLDTTRDTFDCSFDLENNTLTISGENFNLNDFKSVYYRRNCDFWIKDKYISEYIRTEQVAFLRQLEFLIPQAKWINLPSKMYLANNKLDQLQVAQQLGWTIPITQAGTSANNIKVDIKYIIKSISSQLVNINENESCGLSSQLVNSSEITGINFGSVCIVQEYVEKQYEIRVTIIGDNIFAFRINSQETGNPETAVDFRNWGDDKLKFELIDMPQVVVDKCFSITHYYGLIYNTIDIICTPDNEYVFLEINPNGQFGWMDVLIDNRISKALAMELNNIASDN